MSFKVVRISVMAFPEIKNLGDRYLMAKNGKSTLEKLWEILKQEGFDENKPVESCRCLHSFSYLFIQEVNDDRKPATS